MPALRSRVVRGSLVGRAEAGNEAGEEELLPASGRPIASPTPALSRLLDGNAELLEPRRVDPVRFLVAPKRLPISRGGHHRARRDTRAARPASIQPSLTLGSLGLIESEGTTKPEGG